MSEIKKTYEDARRAYEKASVWRGEAVIAARADCQAKIVLADAVVEAAYEVHNTAKKAYAQEVARQ